VIDLPIIVYTYHKNFDILPIFLKRAERFHPNQKIIILSDEEFKSNYKNVIYKDSDPHYLHWKDVLNFVGDYFIYCQEDFLLYSQVDTEKLEKCLNSAKNNNLSYLRLIKSGIFNSKNRKEFDENIFEISSDEIGANFAMQATIWNKNDFYRVYENSKINRIFDEDIIRKSVSKLGLKGAYYYNNEAKRGFYHYDSKVFPYVATALVKGKWNTKEYDKELNVLKDEFNLDFNRRGKYVG